MSVCTFFGHRDTDRAIKPLLRASIVRLIKEKRVFEFYVGNEGTFDHIVQEVSNELLEFYPQIEDFVITSTVCISKNILDLPENFQVLIPEGLETAPPKYAIDHRNRWMAKNADYVIAYIKRPFGGAAKYVEIANKKKKKVINLAEYSNADDILLD